jgi:hypothetical protein
MPRLPPKVGWIAFPHGYVREPKPDHFELLQDAVDKLWDDLEDTSDFYAELAARFPSEKHDRDLWAAISSLDAVIRFLRFAPVGNSPSTHDRKHFKMLEELRRALFDLSEGGSPAPMLRPHSKGRGRRADVSSVLGLKGVLAGLMHCQQRAGMSRHQAAEWIANSMSPKLAARVSRTPVTARMVEEWLDRFGGKHAEESAGRQAYRVWSGPLYSPLTKQKFRTMTERIAADF